MWLTHDTDNLLKQPTGLLSWRKVAVNTGAIKPIKLLAVVMGVLLVALFLPWTQTIFAPGTITTRSPEQRPQKVNAIIGGSIQKWYVREGDMVKKGDTIIKLTEVKETYLDPELLKRTEDQIRAKEQAIDFYRDKVTANQLQLTALTQARDLKLEQARNKVAQATLYLQNDSMVLIAAKTELKIARDQYARQKELYNSGLKSLTELEQRRQALQNAEAKTLIAENKYANAGNDLVNARLEVNQLERDYNEKSAKVTSERFAILSEISTGEAEVTKLKNQFSNYAIRNTFYYVLAPQDGQITRTVAAGVGEVVKEGEMIAMIVPQRFQYAVEMYVRPVDLPLISIGQKVRFQFDAWPAIVFSGWPNVSYGTFGGKVVAIDNSISPNGKFRVLVSEDTQDVKWPTALRLGGGAKGMALLKNVPVWYELWRNFNGFPPDFYQATVDETKNKKPTE